MLSQFIKLDYGVKLDLPVSSKEIKHIYLLLKRGEYFDLLTD